MFSLHETDSRHALNISAGDIDGDGADDVLVSTSGGEPRVYVYRLYGTQQTSFLAYRPHERGELNSDVWVNAEGKRMVVTRMASSVNPNIRFFTLIGAFVNQVDTSVESGDHGDIAAWQPYAEQSPVLVTSELTLGKPDLFVYNEDGSLADIQLFAEFEYRSPMTLAK